MHMIGIDLASGPDAQSIAIVDVSGKVQTVIDRSTLNAKSASRKAEREFIADAICAIISRHGAKVERWDESRDITLCFTCNGVGALIHLDALFGGVHSLIHWHNSERGARHFTARFARLVGDPCHIRPNGRLHHKATSWPTDWYSLAMMLDAGLCLAVQGEAFDQLIEC